MRVSGPRLAATPASPGPQAPGPSQGPAPHRASCLGPPDHRAAQPTQERQRHRAVAWSPTGTGSWWALWWVDALAFPWWRGDGAWPPWTATCSVGHHPVCCSHPCCAVTSGEAPALQSSSVSAQAQVTCHLQPRQAVQGAQAARHMRLWSQLCLRGPGRLQPAASWCFGPRGERMLLHCPLAWGPGWPHLGPTARGGRSLLPASDPGTSRNCVPTCL